jgi:rod shape-determining protein MreC
MKRTSGSTLLFFLLAAISLALLILSSSGRLSGVEGLLTTAARPLLTVFNGVGRRADSLLATVRDLRTLRTTNAQLQTQVDTLVIDNLRLREVAVENQRLRELLRFAQLNPTYDFRGGQVIARVIGQRPTNYLSSLAIDLGREHGIREGMPVVTEAGLVGRIHKVGPRSSTVLLITDTSSGVQALVQRENSRARGVVTGRAGGLPVMEFIAQDEDVTVGDLIVTSGLGGNFPKGLIIGQVVEVQRRDFDMFQQATVRPTVNFDRIEFVLVIMNFQPLPGQPAELEDVG